MTAGALHILVVGGRPAGTLAWCRLLARAGHRATLLRWDEPTSFADASRCCAGSAWLGAVDAGVPGWLQRLGGLLRSGRFSHVLPADPLAHELLCTGGWQAPAGVGVIGPSALSYACASDRCNAISLAARAGLSTLPGTQLERGSAALPIGLPCVARPQRAAAITDGEPALYSTRLIVDPRALDNKLRDDLPRVGVLLQGVPRGQRSDTFVAAVAGRIESIWPPLAPDLLAAMRRMVEQLNWTGPLHVECSRDAGASVFVDLHFGLDGWEHAPAPAGLTAVRALVGFARDTARPAVWADPLPLLRRSTEPVARALHKVSRSVQAQAWGLRRRAAAVPLRPSDSILFVCQGNINRSLVAEQALRAAGFRQVASAGLLGMAGRRPSRPAERYLQEVLRVPSANLRSRSLRQAIAHLPRLDRVVCFERWHAVELLRRQPELRGRVHLLTTLAGPRSGAIDIEDPHGKDDASHRRCFDRIALLLRGAASPAIGIAGFAPGNA